MEGLFPSPSSTLFTVFPPFHIILMKIQGLRIHHSQGGGIKKQKLFIPPISSCRRGVVPQARGTPATVIFRPTLRSQGTLELVAHAPTPVLPTSFYWPLGTSPAIPVGVLPAKNCFFHPLLQAPSSAKVLLCPGLPCSPPRLSPCFGYEEGKHFSDK